MIEPGIAAYPVQTRAYRPPENLAAPEAQLLGELSEIQTDGGRDPSVDAAEFESDAGSEPGVIEQFLFGEDGFSFADLLDFINPLQHIPGVSTIYRYYSGDEIGALPRIVGSVVLGGPKGAIFALVNATLQLTTGKDVGGHAIALAEEGATLAIAAVEDWMADDAVAVAEAKPWIDPDRVANAKTLNSKPWIDPDQSALNAKTLNAKTWVDPDKIETAGWPALNPQPWIDPDQIAQTKPWRDPDRGLASSARAQAAAGGIAVTPWIMPLTPPSALHKQRLNLPSKLPMDLAEAERRWKLNQAAAQIRQSEAARAAAAQAGAAGAR